MKLMTGSDLGQIISRKMRKLASKICLAIASDGEDEEGFAGEYEKMV
jgi:hypothetical protein